MALLNQHPGIEAGMQYKFWSLWKYCNIMYKASATGKPILRDPRAKKMV